MSQYQGTIKHILVDGHYIEEKDFEEASKLAIEANIDIADYLIEEKYISADLFGQAVAEAYDVAYADLNSRKPSKEQILKIPVAVAKKYHAILFDEGEKDVTITTNVPNQKGLVAAMKKVFPKKKVHIAFSLDQDIESVLLAYDKPLADRLLKIIKEKESAAPDVLKEIFNEAITYKASDIHIEPHAHEVYVRLRIDGVLQERAIFPKEVYESVLNRIKVLSHLRIDEHRSTQDGSIRYEMGDRNVDLRISIAPTLYGEKIVARVLTSYIRGFSLDAIGFDPEDKKVISEVSHQPFGMIINVGPTGAGKTTTLYSVMELLNTPDVNITTIEDPVEYRVDGINQIQVNTAKDITFARGLRSIVRQDPDIILVGEIRDQETAEIAVNAALTGHLLLSSFHANDAATAIPRLLDMGVEPFLLASTLELILAQRLVRKICSNCRRSVEYDVADLAKKINGYSIAVSKKITLYEGQGCNVCRDTGFDGRIAIFEYIKGTPEMKDLVLQNPSSRDVWELARSQGSHSLFEDGIKKVLEGITTLDELLRVAKPPEDIKKYNAKKKDTKRNTKKKK